jgi:hypothetical protein
MALILLEQSYLFLESLTKNGGTKHVHYIVKQTPFTARFGLSGRSSVNFKTCRLECELLYDLPTRKEVEAIAGKALEYVVHPSPDGMACTVDFRIKVLTTQHQNNFFLIRATLVGDGERLEVATNPIKSVSKPEQIRRRQTLAQQSKGCDEDNEMIVVPSVSQPAPPVSSSKKRARSEELLSTLEEMKEAQRQQTELLCMLLQKQFQQPVQQAEPEKVPTIDEALALLVRAYEAETCPERPMKLRKLASSFPSKDKSLLAEVGKILSGLQQTLPPETTPVSSLSSHVRDTAQPLACNQFPMFDIGVPGIDLNTLNGEDLSYLNDSIFGWIQGQ